MRSYAINEWIFKILNVQLNDMKKHFNPIFIYFIKKENFVPN